MKPAARPGTAREIFASVDSTTGRGAGTESAGSETEDESLAERARKTFDRAAESKVALGAAVGIGSAALVAAFLFARRGKGDERTARAAARRKA